MSAAIHTAGVTDASAARRTPPAPAGRGSPGRAFPRRALGYLLAAAVSAGCVAGLLALGRATDWKLPKAAALRGDDRAEADDWCPEHGVPDSACVECKVGLLPPGTAHGWCDLHGVSECPLCHPGVAQLPGRPGVTDADRDRAARALAFAPRPENDPKCMKHLRRLQLASGETATRLELRFAPAGRGRVEEVIRAPGETAYDPTRVARVAPRAAGTVWRVAAQVGDKVRRGDVLAVLDAADVGKAKAEFQQALVQLDVRREALAALRPMAGVSVPEKNVQAAEAAHEEAAVRLLTAEQSLANLGLPLRAADVRGLSPADLARRMQFLGLPDALATSLAAQTGSSNLLPVTSPLDGEVVARSAVTGEAADPLHPLFVVADTGRMLLTVRVRSDDAGRVRAGQPVRFRHAGHAGPTTWDGGVVEWVSPAADETTRTVPVRVALPNPSDRYPANAFGAAEIVVRAEADAVVVPAGAVHWDGCCHVVFVRDRDYETPGAPKVVHVRKVRPGAEGVAGPAGPVREVIAGVLPGELVATTGSGFLRSELLKNGLGEGCACCAGK